MKVIRVIGACMTLFIAMPTFAGELVQNATIVRVASSYDGISDNFYILVSGGVGPCANTGLVFPRHLAPSDGFFNRMFAIALTAYTTGSTNVRVYRPGTSDCLAATFIEVRD